VGIAAIEGNSDFPGRADFSGVIATFRSAALALLSKHRG
jgi:hypothetical protein